MSQIFDEAFWIAIKVYICVIYFIFMVQKWISASICRNVTTAIMVLCVKKRYQCHSTSAILGQFPMTVAEIIKIGVLYKTELAPFMVRYFKIFNERPGSLQQTLQKL